MLPFVWIGVFLAGFSWGRPTQLNHEKRQAATYDYIVVGCGASGLVVSNRLSEIAGSTILCLEAGPFDNYEAEIQVPYYIGLQPDGFYDWGISTVPQTQLDGATRRIPMGKGVGGGTLINGMVWNRGNQESFNAWATLGNSGWAWADLLPYFRKSETFTPKTYDDEDFPATPMDSSIHGSSGPVQVSYPNYFWPQTNAWFDALESLGIPTSLDPNAGLSAGGYFLPLDINPTSQTRADARRSYYDPISSRGNFHVLANVPVTRIIFDTSNGLRATGVEYAQGTGGTRQTVYANHDVILAAGAIHTPQLLELSGIGQASILEGLGIQVLQDLPGVGNNLQDHPMIHLNYPYTNPSIVDVNNFANATFNAECADEYYASRTGPWTAKPSQAVAFPSLQQFTTDAQDMLGSAGANAANYLPSNYESTLRAGFDQQVLSIIAELGDETIPAFENLNNNAGGLDLCLMRPLSRGTSHITSTNPFATPAVDPRWLVDPFDYEVMIRAMQFNQRLLDTPSLQALQPSYVDVPYDATTDQLGSILRSRVGTEYHYSCTAAMMPRKLGGVVDTNLIVYGTSNLRIVDTSVFPMAPGAHLQAITYAVAEKAADIIKGVSTGPAKA